MLDLIHVTRDYQQQGFNYPNIRNIEHRFNEILYRVQDYYLKANQFINNNHILISLINSFGVNLYENEFQFLNKIKSNYPSVCRMLGIFSEQQKGVVFNKSNFYGTGVREILFAIDDFSYNDIYGDGTDWTTLKIIRHPYSHFDWNIADGSKNLGYKGYSVILINVPLLLLQYRRWAIKKMQNEVRGTPSHFLTQVVLPSMLKSHINVVLFNKFINVGLGIDDTKLISNKFSLALPNPNDFVEVLINTVTKQIQNSSLELRAIIRSLPAFFGWGDMSSFLKLPHVLNNRNTEGPMVLASLKLWLYVLAIKNSTANGNFKNAFRIKTREWEAEKTFQYLDKETETYIKNFINDKLVPLL